MFNKLLKQLKRHEGFRSKPYRCSAGKLTIGYGRNLEDVGINQLEAERMLNGDIIKVYLKLIDLIPGFLLLGEPRQYALINMGFNLGVTGLLKFKKMLQAIQDGDFKKAAAEAKDSLWYKQVNIRAKEIIYQIEYNRFMEVYNE